MAGTSTSQALLSVAADAPATWTGNVNIKRQRAAGIWRHRPDRPIASGAQINLLRRASLCRGCRPRHGGQHRINRADGNAGLFELQSGAALTTSGGLTNSGALYVDNGGSGGSSLTVDGTLTNSNYVQVGNGYVAGTVTAQGLSNTGTIGIYGTSDDQALLSVVADAPPTWTGTVNIDGNGLLEFGGTSQIGTIASGARSP